MTLVDYYSSLLAISETPRMATATDAAAAGVPPAAEEETLPQASQQEINPWSVSGEVGEDGKVKAINYRKLVDEFGTSLLDDALLKRFERVTGRKPHRFMRRQIVFSHRDMSKILDRYEKVHSPALTHGGFDGLTKCATERTFLSVYRPRTQQ